MRLINIANIITVSRIILTVVFVFLILQAQNAARPEIRLVYHYLTWICFFLAAISDYIDGKLARSYGIVTDFGKFVDPLADKILVLTAFVSFLTLKEINVPLWAVIVILGREFTITGLRLMAMTDSKQILIPNKWNKHKTFSQMFTIFSILTFLVVKYTCEFLKCQNILINQALDYTPAFIDLFIYAAVFLTIVSGLLYLRTHRSIIFGSKKN